MHRFLRAPLTWMIVAECAVVGALTLIAWHTLAGATGPGSDPLLLPPTAAAPAEDALPAAGVPVVGAPRRGPLPGLNLGAGFWRRPPSLLDPDEAGIGAPESVIPYP